MINFRDKQKVWCIKPDGSYKQVAGERRVYTVKNANEGLLYTPDVIFNPNTGYCSYKGINSSNSWHWDKCYLVPVS